MKVLFILDLYKPHIWWVENLFENIINNFVQRWIKVVVLTSRYSKNLKKYEKINENLEIYRKWHNRYDFMFFSIFLWLKLAKNCDIIHTTTYNSAIPANIIWFLSRKKVVLTIHEIFWKLWYEFMWIKWFFFKFFEDCIFKLYFEKYICVSNYTKNNLRITYWISDSKLITIYNWIDYKKRNKDNYRVSEVEEIKKKYNLEKNYCGLYFGRPWISKWLEYYLQVITEIKKEIANFKAILIVPENDKKRTIYIKNLIKNLQIEDSIVWIPWVSSNKIWNYILAVDFVIVPSLAEWFGFAAAETCALDQNLITTNIASLPEVVSGKINFIEPANPMSIKEAVVNFKNWKYIEIPKKKFLWDDNIEKTLEVYQEVLWKKD